MILDLAKMPDGALLHADVCVIGAGATGIALALEFVGSRTTVLLLEAGGLRQETESQQLFASQVAGLPHAGVHGGRIRAFGGTTTVWGGQSARFAELDFLPRPWVPDSGWPISGRELSAYYDRAEAVMNVRGNASYQSLCREFGIAPPAFDSKVLDVDCSQWSTRPNFARAYRRLLQSAPNVTVLLHANVVELVPFASGKSVERVEFRTLQGVRGSARAHSYTVCCGGLESSRLLLSSNRFDQSGLGNHHDVVGRFFQEHLHINLGRLIPLDVRTVHDMFEGFFVNGCKQSPKLVLTSETQQREQCLSAHGEVIFEQPADSSVAALKTVVKAFRGQAAWPGPNVLVRAIRSPVEMTRLAYRYRLQGRSASPSRSPIRLGAQVETAPDPDSRVTLGEVKDVLGMRQLKLNWRIGELERRTLTTLLNVISDQFQRIGIGEVSRRSELSERLTSDGWRDLIHDSAHHMGTARMADDPKRGVVDRDCRVHGLDNLYIGGLAVFPTSGRSSPTLTAIALSIRIADQIKAELQSRARILA